VEVYVGQDAGESWIMRHPLACYQLLAFLIAWLFWIPLAVLLQEGLTARGSVVAIALETLGVIGSVIAAIIVTSLTRGKRGVRRLLGGLRRWRVRPRWYAAACLLVPVLTVIGLGVRAALGIDPAVPEGSALAATLAGRSWIGIALTFPILLLWACFGSPLLEEPGWRGFAVPHMQKRIPVAWAALLVAAIWGLWHLPLFLAFDANLPIALSLITMHGFFLGWLYINTRSLLIAVLGHASLTVANNNLSLADQGVVQVVLTFVLCLAILGFFRPRLIETQRGGFRAGLRSRSDAAL
jgi:uncharacterized protein